MPDEPDSLLKRAIRERRLVAFTSKGYPRIGEPHDYGVKSGVPRLFYYQTGGRSSSKPPRGWRWADLGDMQDLVILQDTFAGPREAPSGQHIEWDTLIASVSAAQRKVERGKKG